MSVPDIKAAVATRRNTVPLVRDAAPADYPAIRDVVFAAYRHYADLIALDIFSPYLADLLDLETHARDGRLLVVEADGRVCGSAAFYPDATVRGFGLPPGWATGRALAVHPAARGQGVARGRGVARALLATCERLAQQAGAPVFAFHTASFMTGAIALYEGLGYRRAPEFDFDMAARLSRFGAAPVMAFAFLRHLTPMRTHLDGVLHARCTARSVHPKRRNHR
jgi:ribosomal protein S18 acetylase RimI-like enzyme